MAKVHITVLHVLELNFIELNSMLAGAPVLWARKHRRYYSRINDI
jgi:hypothetical protein